MKVTFKTKLALATTLMFSCIITPAVATVGGISPIGVSTAQVHLADDKLFQKDEVENKISNEAVSLNAANQESNKEESSGDEELKYAFGDSNVQAKDLDRDAMEQTQGAFWPTVIKIIAAIIIGTLSNEAH